MGEDDHIETDQERAEAHAHEARALIDSARTLTGPKRESLYAEAQVHATLATNATLADQ